MSPIITIFIFIINIHVSFFFFFSEFEMSHSPLLSERKSSPISDANMSTTTSSLKLNESLMDYVFVCVVIYNT